MFERLYARRAASLADSSLKDVLESRPGVISFSGGLPDEKAFPYERIAALTAQVCQQPRAWQYPPTEGLVELREQIALQMQRIGIAAGPENILVTQGSQQGLDLINKAFVDPGDPVFVEAPGYLGALKAVENYEGRLIPLPLDEEGLDVAALRARHERAKYLYTVSTFQNPAGCTLSLARRRELLHIAERRGFFIVEDGAYHHLRFEGDPIPPLKALDQTGHVIYLGSFSKVLVPGIRVGWIVAPRPVIDRLALLKQATDLAGSSFGQLFAAAWLREFGLTPPVELYRQKRDLALAALRDHMPPGVQWNRPQGGFFLWVTLPQRIDTRSLLAASLRAGVSYVPGDAFGGAPNALRFSYSQVGLDEIEEGVRRLARVVAAASDGGELRSAMEN